MCLFSMAGDDKWLETCSYKFWMEQSQLPSTELPVPSGSSRNLIHTRQADKSSFIPFTTDNLSGLFKNGLDQAHARIAPL